MEEDMNKEVDYTPVAMCLTVFCGLILLGGLIEGIRWVFNWLSISLCG
jgi:hypothetical protein